MTNDDRPIRQQRRNARVTKGRPEAPSSIIHSGRVIRHSRVIPLLPALAKDLPEQVLHRLPRPLVGLLVVADAFDALTSQRAYRSPMRADDSLAYLGTVAGALLDPQVIQALQVVMTRRLASA